MVEYGKYYNLLGMILMKSREIKVGGLSLGGTNPIYIQSYIYSVYDKYRY